VFIGNLGSSATAESVADYFSSCGEIQSVRIITGQDGAPKGFGYIDFFSVEAAEKAVGFSHTELEGRDIYVALSPQQP
ncbi:RNA binding protein, identical, partial [Obelidium mucronatum]